MENLNFSSFSLSKEILESIEKLGYKKPSDVQKNVIPLALDDKDIIVKSQTGSGKTASFGIPLCERVEIEQRKPQALVLIPTRELAVQVKDDISNIGRFKRVRCAAIFGKQPIEMQKRELRQRVHIVVGTPGRTLDHMERQTLELDEIKYLIIDEADEMLNMGFIDQVESVIKQLPPNRVTMLFSATISEEIKKLCNKYMINPESVNMSPENATVPNIDQFYYEVEEEEKFNLLNKIIYTQRPDSSIIFCNTRDKVSRVLQNMKEKGYSCRGLHGGIEQKDRLIAIDTFKKGEIQFLIATDVAARGIDVEGITHVINYDIPLEKESYVHRIGRTGRAGSRGTAITFVSTYKVRFLTGIEEYVGYKIPKREIPSQEEVEKGKIIFKDKVRVKPKLKRDKSAEINKEITKIHINAGKKKKIRPGDIVGAITSIQAINAEDIGIIDIQDSFSYVEILNGKGYLVLKEAGILKIKGKDVRIQKSGK